MQADDAVDDGALVDHLTRRREFVALRRNGQRSLGGFLGQRIAQRRAGIDEGGTGHVEAHDLHQHLVGVRGAVEGAGAGAVIGFGLGFEQLRTADLTFGEELAHTRLLVVRQTRGHGPGGNEHGRQVAEGQRCNRQAGNDLVADTEIDD